ncbi:MAG: hypothetical protein ACR2QC_08435 [Gammaproteobacteria bacterium]
MQLFFRRMQNKFLGGGGGGFALRRKRFRLSPEWRCFFAGMAYFN